MSYFDGIIPKACSSCFFWDGQKWVQSDPGLCDECDHTLDMFPMIDHVETVVLMSRVDGK